MPFSGVQTCARSEEHTSELQSHDNLVCRLLLEKKNHNADAWSETELRHGTCGGPRVLRPRASCPRPWPSVASAPAPPPPGPPSFFFFFNDTATPEISPLSLHDALPICSTSPAKTSDSSALISSTSRTSSLEMSS